MDLNQPVTLTPSQWAQLRSINADRPRPPKAQGFKNVDATLEHIEQTLAWCDRDDHAPRTLR